MDKKFLVIAGLEIDGTPPERCFIRHLHLKCLLVITFNTFNIANNIERLVGLHVDFFEGANEEIDIPR